MDCFKAKITKKGQLSIQSSKVYILSYPNNLVLLILESLRNTIFLFLLAILNSLFNECMSGQSLKGCRLILNLVCNKKSPSKEPEPLLVQS